MKTHERFYVTSMVCPITVSHNPLPCAAFNLLNLVVRMEGGKDITIDEDGHIVIELQYHAINQLS